MKTTLIIPTLNEIDGVRIIMPRINRSWCDEIVVLDGGSTDGTVEWLEQNGWRVIRQKERGLGNGYRQAQRETTGDVFITFSPDGNSLPEKIPELVETMKKGYDMVIVSRYRAGAKSEDDDALTSLGNPIFTFLINKVFGGHYTDALVIFRAYTRKIVADLKIDAPYLMYETQLSIRAAKAGLKIAEISGDEPKRIGGERKMRPFRDGLNVLREIGSNLIT